MLKKIKSLNTPITDSSIVLICVVYNEILLLPYFIEYYKTIGVTHFIFIDNGSTDSTIKYLSTLTEVDIEINQSYDSYAKSNFGIDWVNSILNSKLNNKWCLVVDIDELLILPPEVKTLIEIKSKMEKTKTNILQTVLIDFYPIKFNNVENYIVGQPFFSHSNCFHKFTNETIWSKIAPDGSTEIKGGLRHVISNYNKKPNSTSVCLTKKSFFKNNFFSTHYLRVGMHWILPKDFTCWWPPEKAYSNWSETNKQLNFFKEKIVLAHFKYIKPDIRQVFQQRIERNQDWNNSSEYKNYLQHLTESYFDPLLTNLFTDTSTLYEQTVLKVKHL
jgi:hypothetical protein